MNKVLVLFVVFFSVSVYGVTITLNPEALEECTEALGGCAFENETIWVCFPLPIHSISSSLLIPSSLQSHPTPSHSQSLL